MQQKKVFEPCFCFGEQQTKTHITAALDAVCGSYFLQEPPVFCERLTYEHSLETLTGRVDYLCTYSDRKNTEIKLLIEVKQGWIRYFPARIRSAPAPKQSRILGASRTERPVRRQEPDWTIYNWATKRHKDAVVQLESIMSSLNYVNYEAQNLYSLALTVLPLFCRYDGPGTEAAQEPLTIPEILMTQIGREARDRSKADAYGTFVVPTHLYGLVEYQMKDGTLFFESYPGIVFLWSVLCPKPMENQCNPR